MSEPLAACSGRGRLFLDWRAGGESFCCPRLFGSSMCMTPAPPILQFR